MGFLHLQHQIPSRPFESDPPGCLTRKLLSFAKFKYIIFGSTTSLKSRLLSLSLPSELPRDQFFSYHCNPLNIQEPLRYIDCKHTNLIRTYGGFHRWGYPNSWMVTMENPNPKLMIQGYPPFYETSIQDGAPARQRSVAK